MIGQTNRIPGGDSIRGSKTALWRHGVLAVLVFGSMAALMMAEPIPQNPAYHEFADARAFWGIPNFFDTISNLPFLFVGLAGLRLTLTGKTGSSRAAWIVLFAGVTLVSAGSSYYHLNPTDQTLVWDRLPMTVGFMGLFTAVWAEHFGASWSRRLLGPAILLGICSVLWWQWTGDLRPYAWVQFVPLLVIPTLVFLFRGHYTHRWLLLLAFGAYAMAKVTETFDGKIFRGTGEMFSGHSTKHLFAAGACWCVLLMLKKRRGSMDGAIAS